MSIDLLAGVTQVGGLVRQERRIVRNRRLEGVSMGVRFACMNRAASSHAVVRRPLPPAPDRARPVRASSFPATHARPRAVASTHALSRIAALQ